MTSPDMTSPDMTSPGADMTSPGAMMRTVGVRGNATADEVAVILAVMSRLQPGAEGSGRNGRYEGWRRGRIAALRATETR